MKRIAFINEKGGSCKTTLAVNSAAYFARYLGKKVLLVDMDPQGQAGKSMGINVREENRTVFELLLKDNVSAADVILPTRIDGLDMIVSNKKLADFPLIISKSDRNRNKMLARKLNKVEDYDYLIIDSPPSLGVTTINIMMAVNRIVIPVNMTYFALDGAAEIEDTVAGVVKDLGHPDLKISMVVPTLYRNTNLAEAIRGKLGEHFGKRLSNAVIRFNVAIDEAQSHGLTIWEYQSWSEGGKMIAEFAKELASKR